LNFSLLFLNYKPPWSYNEPYAKVSGGKISCNYVRVSWDNCLSNSPPRLIVMEIMIWETELVQTKGLRDGRCEGNVDSNGGMGDSGTTTHGAGSTEQS
jgi:hypothetical protein